ncbi:VOC family protein [Tabrizicola sp. M-4]|uniref:VOC family protein n=1 Tax=Tabrizicola sp. M-4 TaxID=3055847 RepID=UPI003DA8C021
MNSAEAPMQIGTVTLTVRDLDATADFYAQALGLAKLRGDRAEVTLGAGGTALLRLIADPAARQRSAREAGLFHTAFLMPDRPALARWVHHAAGSRLPVQGASDHKVSEAIYFADPEGNGIEIYVDRPRRAWTKPDGSIHMTTDPLDVDDLAAAADGPWTGAPDGMTMGHVHLQVGDVAQAEAFYSGTLGFPVTAHYPGAAFYGAGGYHHHLATNTWNSRGAGMRSPSTGLAAVEIRADAPSLAAIAARTGGQTALTDPWGTAILVTEKR